MHPSTYKKLNHTTWNVFSAQILRRRNFKYIKHVKEPDGDVISSLNSTLYFGHGVSGVDKSEKLKPERV